MVSVQRKRGQNLTRDEGRKTKEGRWRRRGCESQLAALEECTLPDLSGSIRRFLVCQSQNCAFR